MTTQSRPPATRAAAVATAALACLALGLTTVLPAASAGSSDGGVSAQEKPKKDKHGDKGKDRDKSKENDKGKVDKDVRFSTFNASLNRTAAGQLLTDLASGTNAQAANAAETIQRTAPDVVLVNEFDYDAGGKAAELFRDNYLEKSWHGSTPIDYPYYYVAPSNTGMPSGFDLDNDGVLGAPGTQDGADDSLGFGFFPGQYGMVVYSKYPIATDEVRTFQSFLWKDMPGALLPNDPATEALADWYSAAELATFRLSSKSHWDVPITLAKNKTVHFLVSHPTPPVFDDGQDDRNGKRNHDEIRFWADYISTKAASSYIYDDKGVKGGLHRGAKFVIAGDQNSDPVDGDSIDGAIQQLLDHPRVDSRTAPESAGGVEAALQGGTNVPQSGPDAQDTADFDDAIIRNGSGNLRVDYVLPRKGLKVLASEVFWPVASAPFSYLTGVFPFPTSDHRLVWMDLKLNHKH